MDFKKKYYDSCNEHSGLTHSEEKVSKKREWRCKKCKWWFWGPGGPVV